MLTTLRMNQPDTKERILNAAERLFAAEGFHSTSLRALTGEAGVNLAAVNYHFGSKESLLEAVFERRLVPLNRERLQRLEDVRDRARKGGERPAARDILHAFIEPTLRFRTQSPGAEAFVSLVGRAIADPDDTIRTIFMRHMKHLLLVLYETMTEALPHLSRADLFWRLHLALGAMSHAMWMVGRFQILPPGVDPPTDADSLAKLLLDFICAGMEAPCES